MRSSLLYVNGRDACFASRSHLCSYPGAMHTPSKILSTKGHIYPRTCCKGTQVRQKSCADSIAAGAIHARMAHCNGQDVPLGAAA